MGRLKSRYAEFDGPPDFLFVLPTIAGARRAAEIADQVCCGAIGRPSLPEHSFRYPGRDGLFFTAAPPGLPSNPARLLAAASAALPAGAARPNAKARQASGAASAGLVVEYPLARALEHPRGLP